MVAWGYPEKTRRRGDLPPPDRRDACATLKKPQRYRLLVSIGSRCVGELLGLEAEFGGEEGVLLRHRGLCAVQAVEEELAKEWETDQTGARNAMLALGIDEEELVRAVGGGDVGVFAQFDVAFRAEDHEAAVAPGAESGGGEPIHAEVTRRAVVGEEVAFAEILEVRMRGVGDISGCSVNDFGVFGTGEKGTARIDGSRCRKECRRIFASQRTRQVEPRH